MNARVIQRVQPDLYGQIIDSAHFSLPASVPWLAWEMLGVKRLRKGEPKLGTVGRF